MKFQRTTPSLTQLQAGQPAGQPLKFGRLTPVREVARYRWECRCDCGNIKTFVKYNVLNGVSASCGCWRKEYLAGLYSKPERRSNEYRSWGGMKQRCSEGGSSAAHYYDRGIRLCRRWWSSFDAFFLDMGRKPSCRFSIDRIDNNKGYDCGRHDLCEDCRRRNAAPNCRWATAAQQARNRSNSKRFTYEGVTATIAELSERSGVDYDTMKSRLARPRSTQDAADGTARSEL